MAAAVRAAHLRMMLKQPGNDRCADCRAPQPTWASYNIGVFLCQDCAGIHRSLGTHVSKIRSVTLDIWDQDAIDKMLMAGNNRINSLMEALLKGGDRISYDAAPSTRSAFIRAKYIDKRFENLHSASDEAKPADIFAGLNLLIPRRDPIASLNPESPDLLAFNFSSDVRSKNTQPEPSQNANSSFSFINPHPARDSSSIPTGSISDDSLLSFGLFNFSSFS